MLNGYLHPIGRLKLIIFIIILGKLIHVLHISSYSIRCLQKAINTNMPWVVLLEAALTDISLLLASIITSILIQSRLFLNSKIIHKFGQSSVRNGRGFYPIEPGAKRLY